MLHDHGISTWGSFVFGFDTDTLSVFDRTVEEAIAMKLTMASFALLTPYPGTPLYKRLLSEGRLTDPHWWMRYDHDAGSPYYQPKHMSRDQLREGWVKAWLDFYTFSSMWRRFVVRPASSWIQALGYWPLNVMQRHRSGDDLVRERGADHFADAAQAPTPVGFSELKQPQIAGFRLPLIK
jgi:radical SAM superfamily enzyme YgiQ (UPF0313 family)